MGSIDAQDRLVVRLLGDPEVRRGSTLVTAFESHRLQSLLAFLIVGRERVIARQRLAFEFWPDSTDGQARTNLRQALHRLRHALGNAEQFVRDDSHCVQWRADGPAAIDVVRFERDAVAGLASGDEEALARAADEYRGDLLAGRYDDWLLPERARLRALAADVLRALVGAARRREDWARAAQVGERLVRLDPFDEGSHRLLIDVHVDAGDRARGLRRYHECAGLLRRELGVTPDADTVARYLALIADDRPPPEPSRPAPSFERVPLVGRPAELAELRAAWFDAAAGRPQFALVAGEPGIGKSRLVEELLATCRRDGALTVAGRAYEANDAIPYGPMIEILRSAALRPAIDALGPRGRRRLARVLPGVDADDPTVGADIGSDDRRQLFDAIAEVLVGSHRPLVTALDDLHWCDPDTFDLIEAVLRAAAAGHRPVLLVGTVRAEELVSRPPLRAAITRLHATADGASQIDLGRLDAASSAELVAEITSQVSAATQARIVEAAAGNPLFLVEMARHGDHHGDTAAALPPRVQAVIDARLDLLSEAAAELVFVAAVVGRSFTLDLVSRLLAEQVVVTAVDELWRRGIVRERGCDAYEITHDRIRDVAYRRIGPARRRSLHGEVAMALRALGGEPAQIAYHCERAGQVDAAIAAYRRAVDAAVRAFAHQDVIEGCRRALQLVAGRPPGTNRDDTELGFLVPLGVALMAGPGISNDDLGVYERARALRQRRGLAADPSTLRISANAAIERRDYPRARSLGATLLQRGRQERDEILVTEGLYLIGVTSFWLGDLRRSRRSLEAALAHYDPRHTAAHLERFGQDPRAVCLVRLALTSFELGDDAGAAASCRAGVDAASELGHDYTSVYVRIFAAWYHAERGDADRAAQVVAAAPRTTNSTEPIARHQFDGWALSCAGDAVGGIRRLDAALDLARAGPLMFEPAVLLHLAASRRAAGDPTGALAAAEQARGIAAAAMPYHLPEATRLSGELLAEAGGDPAEALRLLAEAVRLATGHGAAVHELRARTALVRAARSYAPTVVEAHERDLRSCRARLAALEGLADLAAADVVLAAQP